MKIIFSENNKTVVLCLFDYDSMILVLAYSLWDPHIIT